MPKLLCDVRNCSYNKEEHCTLTYIKVDGDTATNVESTCCASFDPTAYAANNCSHEVQAEVDIKCSVGGCLFNDGCHCKAEDMKISGATTASCSHDTQCASFWSK